jgi:hypothetical protein
MILNSNLKQSHKEKISKMILLIGIVIGLTFNAEIVMKSYSQPTPTPAPSPGSQGVVPPQQQLQQQPQQQPQSGQAELTRLLGIEDNIQKLLAQLDNRRAQIESQLSPPPELTPKPAPLNQQQQQEYFRLLQDITNRQQQLLDQLQKLDLQIQQVQQPALRQPPPGATEILQALPQDQLQQLPPTQQQPTQQQPTQQQPTQQPEVPVTVKFISIKVNNDRDPNIVVQNDGEYLLDAFVNGEKVSLGTKGGFLWDVRGGAPAYRFPQTAQITVSVPRDGSLTVNTVGSEVDGCGNTRTLPGKLPDPVLQVAKKAGIPGLSTVSKYLDTLNPAFGIPIPPGASTILSALGLKSLLDPATLVSWASCKLDPNDTIGEVNQVYSGPDFGRGLKSVESDTGYWVLTYEIQPSA